MTDNSDFQVVVGGRISSASSDYEVQDLLGSGSYGEVSRCKKLATDETVAVKILKSLSCIEDAKEEEEILKKMKALNSDKFNIVVWNDSFAYEGRYCLEFEKLDINLLQLLQKRQFMFLELKEIRPILQQLATALEFLKRAGIVHADLKPENIMMVDHLQQPLKVKVIDFGLASDNPEAQTGSTLQTQWYRSPEVLLGAPFDEAIDVWSLGCIAAEMFMGTPLFPGINQYDMMRHISYTIGKPPDHLLNAGIYTTQYFHPTYAGLGPPLWKFMSAIEVRHFNCMPRTITSLNYLAKLSGLSGEDAEADSSDRANFVDSLTKMLLVDPAQRITPSQILQHPYLTMSHLDIFNNSPYVKSCTELMAICQGQSSNDGEDEAQLASNSTADPDQSCPSGLSGKEQPSLLSTASSAQNSPAKHNYRGNADDSGCGSRNPDNALANEFLDVAVTVTGGQTSPPTSMLHKRKRDEADLPSDRSSPAKKLYVYLNKELMDGVNKLLLNIVEAQSSLTQVGHDNKRKRADEVEVVPDKRRRSGEEEAYPHKRKRADEEEVVPDKKRRSSHEETSPHKRKRIDEDEAAPDMMKRAFEEAFPEKRKWRCLDGGEE